MDPNARQEREKENLTILNNINPLECKAVLADCETLLQDFLTRPQLQPQNYDEKCFDYNILVWDTETTTIGKSAEIIQITVMSSDKQFCFSEYITPTTAISQSASKVHGLTSKVVNGNTVMCKDGKEVLSFPLEESLTRLLNFIETTRNHCKNETGKPVISVMIGHNSSLFDTPTLLRSAGTDFVAKLTSLDVLFADSLLLFKKLRSQDHPSSKIIGPCKGNKLTTLYSHIFDETFNAHDATEDVKALNKTLFQSALEITPEVIIDHAQAITAKQAFEDMTFIDQRHARVKTFTQMSYPDGRTVISDSIKQKLAVSGIVYETLWQIYNRFGKTGLLAIIALPNSMESGIKSRRRITAYPRIQAAILNYFDSINS